MQHIKEIQQFIDKILLINEFCILNGSESITQEQEFS